MDEIKFVSLWNNGAGPGSCGFGGCTQVSFGSSSTVPCRCREPQAYAWWQRGKAHVEDKEHLPDVNPFLIEHE